MPPKLIAEFILGLRMYREAEYRSSRDQRGRLRRLRREARGVAEIPYVTGAEFVVGGGLKRAVNWRRTAESRTLNIESFPQRSGSGFRARGLMLWTD
jgi:hypothetical protein